MSEEHQIPLHQMDQLLIDLHNDSLFYQDPIQTKYFLYNPRKNFIKEVKKSYPVVYRQLFNGLRIYRKKMGQFLNESIINYLIHLLFTHWHKLLSKLQEKAEHSVDVLVYSPTDLYHARMIKDYLHYHFRNHITIDLHTKNPLTITSGSVDQYDIVVSNNPLPELDTTLSMCIEALPTAQDIHVIRRTIKDIRLKKLKHEA